MIGQIRFEFSCFPASILEEQEKGKTLPESKQGFPEYAEFSRGSSNDGSTRSEELSSPKTNTKGGIQSAVSFHFIHMEPSSGVPLIPIRPAHHTNLRQANE